MLSLSTLLADISSLVEIEAAFQAYDVVRWSRAHRVVESSTGTARIIRGQDVEAGVDPERMWDALTDT